MVDLRVREWKTVFGSVQGGKEILSLTGEDLRLLEKGDVLVCTPTQVLFALCSLRLCY
jgi:pre-mRNA-splicing helicase BRR2